MNEIIHGDCLKVLPTLKRDSVDLVFADPPYFLSREGGTTCRGGKRADVGKGEWDVPTTPDEMHEFNRRWIEECARVLHPAGAIWICGTMHNIGSCLFACQQLEFKLLNLVTWKKPNPPPNLGCRTFTHSAEHLIWARMPGPANRYPHRFNYRDMRSRDGCGRQLKDVWEFALPRANETRWKKHPAQKPEALVERVLLACTNPGDLVVDPFVGSGTTPTVAKRTGRRCLGIDSDRLWCEKSRQRVEATPTQMDLLETGR